MTPHVAILIPSRDEWHARFALSLIMALVDYASNVQGAFSIKNKRGSILPQLREKMVEEVLGREGLTHILMVDSDQTFPPDTLRRLLAHDKDFVAANIATKRRPSCPTARMLKDGKPAVVYTTPTSPALGEVWRVGLGLALMRADIFQRLKKPWFGIRWNEKTNDFVGEDWWFCERLEEAKIPIYVDHRLSLQVGHIGGYEYTHADCTRDFEEIRPAGEV